MSNSTIPTIEQPARRVAAITANARPHQTFQINISTHSDKTVLEPRPAVIGYRFFDINGRVLDSAYSPHHYSSIVGARYRYILQPEIGKPIFLENIIAPIGSSTFEVCVLTWQLQCRDELQATLKVTDSSPTSELIDKLDTKKDGTVLLEIIATILDNYSKDTSVDLLFKAFQKTWQLNDFKLCWKATQYLLLSCSGKPTSKLYTDAKKKFEYLQTIATTNIQSTPRSRKSGKPIAKANRPVLRLINLSNLVESLPDLMDKHVIPPCDLIPSVFISPVGLPPSDDDITLWKYNELLAKPWWIQAGLSSKFVSRASPVLVQRYALTLLMDRYPQGTICAVHAAPGPSGYELGVIGLALAQHNRVPFIYEFDTGLFDTESAQPGSFPMARKQTAIALCQQASQVIAYDNESARVLQSHGVTQHVAVLGLVDHGQALNRIYRTLLSKRLSPMSEPHC